MSFASAQPLGLDLDLDDAARLPVVRAAKDAAAELRVPVGAIVEYLHDEQLRPGADDIDAVLAKVVRLSLSLSKERTSSRRG